MSKFKAIVSAESFYLRKIWLLLWESQETMLLSEILNHIALDKLKINIFT